MTTIVTKIVTVIRRISDPPSLGHKRSPRWPWVRDSFVKDKTCAGCGRKNKLNVHHIKPFYVFPELELEPTNLIVLCEGPTACHLVLGHCGNWKQWNPNVRSDALHQHVRFAEAKELARSIGGMMKTLLAFVALCALAIAAHAQSVAPVPTPRPVDVQVHRTKAAPLAVKIDGSDAQVTAPGLRVVREYDPTPGVVRLSVTGHRYGCYMLTVTTTKDGKMASQQFRYHVVGIGKEKLP